MDAYIEARLSEDKELKAAGKLISGAVIIGGDMGWAVTGFVEKREELIEKYRREYLEK